MESTYSVFIYLNALADILKENNKDILLFSRPFVNHYLYDLMVNYIAQNLMRDILCFNIWIDDNAEGDQLDTVCSLSVIQIYFNYINQRQPRRKGRTQIKNDWF